MLEYLDTVEKEFFGEVISKALIKQSETQYPLLKEQRYKE